MARRLNRCPSSTGPLVNEPLFSGGIEKWSSYHGAMIGWRVDLEGPDVHHIGEGSRFGQSEGVNRTLDQVPQFLAEARVTP
jgi:hypothetical protein